MYTSSLTSSFEIPHETPLKCVSYFNSIFLTCAFCWVSFNISKLLRSLDASAWLLDSPPRAKIRSTRHSAGGFSMAAMGKSPWRWTRRPTQKKTGCNFPWELGKGRTWAPKWHGLCVYTYIVIKKYIYIMLHMHLHTFILYIYAHIGTYDIRLNTYVHICTYSNIWYEFVYIYMYVFTSLIIKVHHVFSDPVAP